MAKFSKSEAFSFGWSQMKSNFIFFLGILLTAFVVQMVPGWLSESLKQNLPFLSFVVSVIGWMIQILITMGMIKIALRLHDGERAEFADLYRTFPLFLNYLAGSILYAAICIIGVILLVIPGIIWGIKYQYFGYLVVDQGLGPIEALKRSGQITQGEKWNLFLLSLLSMGVMLLGVLALVVGLFAAIPVLMMTNVFVYRKLLSSHSTSAVSVV